MSSTDTLPARRELRARTIAAVRNPHDAAAHLARLQATLQLDDAEPLQGVLADLFVILPGDETTMRQVALQLANATLDKHTLTAPYDGVVVERAREVGTALPGGTPLFTVALGSLPKRLYSHGSALIGTIQQVAGAGQGVGNGFGSQLLFLGDLGGGLAV